MEGTGLYAYGFRYYDPASARFTGVDPIADQFAFVSGFNYAENEPIGHIDLHGLQKLRVSGLIRGYDIPAWRKSAIEAITLMQFPVVGNRIGNGKTPYGTRLAKTAGRIARHAAGVDNSTLTGGRGSQQNAFRHTLLSASITREFGTETATLIMNAHEGVGPGGNLTVDWSIPFEGDRNYADAIADVMNNEIGRILGEANPNVGVREMAVLVGYEFRDNGLYTVSGDEESGYSITRTKISPKQLTEIITNILSLNEDGFNSEEAATKRKMDEN